MISRYYASHYENATHFMTILETHYEVIAYIIHLHEKKEDWNSGEDLESRLNLNGRNGKKPSSSDGYSKKNR